MACRKSVFLLILIYVLITATPTGMLSTRDADDLAFYGNALQISEKSLAKGEYRRRSCCWYCLDSNAGPHDRVVNKNVLTSEFCSKQPRSSWDFSSEVLRLSKEEAQHLLEDPLFHSGLILYARNALLITLFTHYGNLKRFLWTVMMGQLKWSAPCVSPWNLWLEERHFQCVLCLTLMILHILNITLLTVLMSTTILVASLHYSSQGYTRPQITAKMAKYLNEFLKTPQRSLYTISMEKTNLLIKQDIAAETRRICEKAKIGRKKRKNLLGDLLDFSFWKTNTSRLEFACALYKVDYSDVLHRIASYCGPFHERCIATERLSVLQMAQNGFYYPGSGNAVRCAGCGFTVTLEEIRSDLSEPQYHNSASCFVLVDGNNAATRSTSTNQPGDAEHEQNALDQAPSQPSGILANGETPGDDNQSAPEAAGGRHPCTDSATYFPHRNSFPSKDGDGTVLYPPTTTCFGRAESTPPSRPVVTVVAPSSSSVAESRAAQVESGAFEQMVTAAESAPRQMPSSTAAVTSSQIFNNASDSDGATAAAATGQSEKSMILATGSAPSGYSANSALANDVSKGWIDDQVIETEFETSLSKPNRIDHIRNIDCKKNEGHHDFLWTSTFQNSSMPTEVDHPSLYHLIKHMAQLTVRVVVSVTSDARPRGDRCLKRENRKSHRFGTGFVYMEDNPTGAPYQSPASCGSRSNTLRFLMKTFLRKHEKGHVYIVTTRQTVYDKLEASNCYVDFFYDSPDRKDVITVRGVSVVHGNFEGDYSSILKCKVSDNGLLEMIKEAKQNVLSALENISSDWMERLVKQTFIISHPHGSEKVLSYGESAVIKYFLDVPEAEGGSRRLKQIKGNQPAVGKEYEREILLYTTDTCPGSSGAPVITFIKDSPEDEDNVRLAIWVHNGVDIASGLGSSTMRACTRSSGTRRRSPASVNSQPPPSPEIYTNPVANPSYIPYMNRLESFPINWTSVHTAQELAFGGFYFAGYSDCVRCFVCGVGLRSWKPGDNMYIEHGRFRPGCRFLRQLLAAYGGGGGGEFYVQPPHSSDPSLPTAPSQSEVCDENEKTVTMSAVVPKVSLTTSEEAQTCVNKVMLQVTQDVAATEQRNEGLKPEEKDLQAEAAEKEMPVEVEAIAPENEADAEQEGLITVLRREKEMLKRRLLCKMCGQKPINVLFLPCGELYTCSSCCKLLTHCPSCRAKILMAMITYFT